MNRLLRGVFLWGLLFFFAFPTIGFSTGMNDQAPDWNWLSRSGQWIGDLFKKQDKQKLNLVKKEKKNKQYGDGENNSLVDNLLPISDSRKKVGRVHVIYNAHLLSHYRIDLALQKPFFWELDEKASKLGNYFFNEINNTLWQTNIFLSRLTVWILENALTLDLIEDVGQSISEGLKRLSGFEDNLSQRGIYGLLFPFMIIFLGFWIGWKAIAVDDSEGATRGIVHAVVVILFSFSFFYYSQSIVSTMNQVSSDLTREFLGISTNIIQVETVYYTSEEATAIAGNNLWSIMVYKPYLLLQYGTTEMDSNRVEKLLKASPQSVKRDKLVMKEVAKTSEGGYENINMTAKNNSTRLGFITMVLFLNLFVGMVVILLAAGLPFFQLYFMFLILLSPIALAWAIVPAWKETLYRWSSEVLGALLMKLALGVLLAIFFAFSSALYDFSADKGYVFMMFMQFCLLVLLMWKSKQIFQLVTSPAVFMSGSLSSNQDVEGWLKKLSRGMRDIDYLLKKNPRHQQESDTYSVDEEPNYPSPEDSDEQGIPTINEPLQRKYIRPIQRFNPPSSPDTNNHKQKNESYTQLTPEGSSGDFLHSDVDDESPSDISKTENGTDGVLPIEYHLYPNEEQKKGE